MNQTITTGPGFHFASAWEQPAASPTPDQPEVPWYEKGQIDTYFLSVKEVDDGVTALRADRDYYREWARGLASTCQDIAADKLELQSRIRELEAAQARQIAEIARLAKPKPADDWRGRITRLVSVAIAQREPGYIADEYAAAFRELLDKHFPTPPPDAAEGATR